VTGSGSAGGSTSRGTGKHASFRRRHGFRLALKPLRSNTNMLTLEKLNTARSGQFAVLLDGVYDIRRGLRGWPSHSGHSRRWLP
jgi:hypothetical protein